MGFGAILLIFLLSIGSDHAADTGPTETPNLEALQAQLAQLEADITNKQTRMEAALKAETSAERQRRLSLIEG